MSDISAYKSVVLSDDEDAPKAGPSSSKAGRFSNYTCMAFRNSDICLAPLQKMDPKVPKSTSMLIDLDNKDEKKDAKKSKEVCKQKGC